MSCRVVRPGAARVGASSVYTLSVHTWYTGSNTQIFSLTALWQANLRRFLRAARAGRSQIFIQIFENPHLSQRVRWSRAAGVERGAADARRGAALHSRLRHRVAATVRSGGHHHISSSPCHHFFRDRKPDVVPMPQRGLPYPFTCGKHATCESSVKRNP